MSLLYLVLGIGTSIYDPKGAAKLTPEQKAVQITQYKKILEKTESEKVKESLMKRIEELEK